MELKSYQKDCINDLISFCGYLDRYQNITVAYDEYLKTRKDYPAQPPYKNNFPGVPHVCFKVPTGGGKTFMAAAAIRPIIDALPPRQQKVVVWLVPSDTILTQTYASLSNARHPYNQRLKADFGGRVMIYNKEQLLNGMQFSPDTVTEQLSVCILSYDSFRTSRKEGRKAFQENGNLAAFQQIYDKDTELLYNADKTSLVQVLRQFHPIVIVDESHHAQSDLSIEMLQNFNPSFILDLTATPKDNSNIISYVSPKRLKDENMVKLPVIVHNRNEQAKVFEGAIAMRRYLEALADNEATFGKPKIRPIVLFQAETKGKEDNTTFDKIKDMLINDYQIPAEQIAIKTAKVNELKGIDLLAADCPIRFIITINALKEGWDCPYAYILASLANRSSAVEVEQILGRILRRPYTTQYKADMLNMCYVYTSSQDFKATLDNIIAGLNNAGFSEQDYRAEEEEASEFELQPETVPFNFSYPEKSGQIIEPEHDTSPDNNINNEPIPASIPPAVPATEMGTLPPEVEQDIRNARQVAAAEKGKGQSESVRSFEEERKMSHYPLLKEKYPGVSKLQLPQFFYHEAISGIFAELNNSEEIKLSKEFLWRDFTLRDKDTEIDFENIDAEIYAVDIYDENRPQYEKLSLFDAQRIMETYKSVTPAEKVSVCIKMLYDSIDRKKRSLDSGDIRGYIERIVNQLDNDKVDHVLQHRELYARKITAKIEALQDKYAKKQFEELLTTKKIYCKPSYKFPREISPVDVEKNIRKSLYAAEDGRMNGFEHRVIVELASLDNILWWHRNRERKDFVINGFINHYPDFIAMTTKGRLLVIETKGDDRDNSDSRNKLELGRKWADKAGDVYAYFMVFDNNPLEGAQSFDDFFRIVKDM